MMIRLVAIIILAHFTQIVTSPHRECENASNVLGFAVVRFDSGTVLHLFAEADSSKQPLQVLRFFNDPAINSLSFRVEGRENYPLLRPEAHKLDYSIFELPVKSKRNAWLEVMVDPQTEKSLWMQETQTVRFIGWLQQMQKAFAVERKKHKD